MTPPVIREVLRSIDVVDESTIEVRGRPLRLADLLQRAGDGVGGVSDSPLVRALTHAIYSELYTRVRKPTGMVDLDREFVASLSAANASLEGWDSGWVVVGAEANRFLVRKDGMTVYAVLDDLRAADGSPRQGETVHVRIGKERPFISPGFYFALGDTVDAAERGSPLVRIYMNLESTGAAAFVSAVTEVLNAEKVPFAAKVASSPHGYVRADAAVVYVRKHHFSRSISGLKVVRDRVAPHLVPATPMFAKRMASGVSVAEDPPGSWSFGQHRSRAVALAVAEAHAGRVRTLARQATIVKESFKANGIDPVRPHLSLGSQDEYVAWN
jgi:HopA1 effector protein family